MQSYFWPVFPLATGLSERKLDVKPVSLFFFLLKKSAFRNFSPWETRWEIFPSSSFHFLSSQHAWERKRQAGISGPEILGAKELRVQIARKFPRLSIGENLHRTRTRTRSTTSQIAYRSTHRTWLRTGPQQPTRLVRKIPAIFSASQPNCADYERGHFDRCIWKMLREIHFSFSTSQRVPRVPCLLAVEL